MLSIYKRKISSEVPFNYAGQVSFFMKFHHFMEITMDTDEDYTTPARLFKSIGILVFLNWEYGL